MNSQIRNTWTIDVLSSQEGEEEVKDIYEAIKGTRANILTRLLCELNVSVWSYRNRC